MKMYLISDNIDTCTGMRLAGVEGAVVHEKEELRAELNRVMADKDVAVVILTEKFGREFPEVVNEAASGTQSSALIEIPDRPWHYKRREFPYLLCERSHRSQALE